MLKKVMLLLRQEDLEDLINIVDSFFLGVEEGHPAWLMYIKKRFYHAKHNKGENNK